MMSHKFRVIFAIIPLAAACGLAHAASLQEIDRPDDRFPRTPRLTVTGQAELEKPADQVNIRLGVTTEAEQSQTAIEQNSRKMQDVISALQTAGLGEKEYQTSNFQVQPIYSRPPKQPGPEWQPRITGFRVINSIQIKTQKLNLAGKLLQVATEAGANSIDSIHFDLADKRKHRAEAIAAATANARSDAQALAAAAGLRLVRVLSINLDGGVPVPPPYPMMEMRAMAQDMAAEPPIQPGDVTVSANVTIMYEIAPAE